MAEIEMAATLAQFGAAGLVGWMWLSERRAAAQRERQLTEAHERVVRQHEEIGVLVKALDDNTRALSSLEAGQRRLLEMLDTLAELTRTRRAAASTGKPAPRAAPRRATAR